MRAVIQRVTSARVLINEMEYSRIGRGLLVLVGVEKEDTDEDAVALARRIAELRIFEDDAGKMNRSISEIGGGIIAVSQLNLLADFRRGRRPSSDPRAPPHIAQPPYKRVLNKKNRPLIASATGGVLAA